MMYTKYSLLSFLCSIFIFLIIGSFMHLGTICASSPYVQGTCSNSSTSICYTKAGSIVDMAPGYQCGDLPTYVLGTAASGINPTNGGNPLSGISNNVPLCIAAGATDVFTNPGGVCCDPGTPLPSLPPHSGYGLGSASGPPGCAQDSICYTNPPSGSHVTGQQCGNLKGWYYGTKGGSSTEPPTCGTGGVCCDATQPSPAPPNPCPSQKGLCTSIDTALGTIDVSGPGGFIAKIFGVLLSFAGGIAMLLIIYSGYRLMTAQGDPEKSKEAREILTAAIIGLLFMIFSVTILQILGVDILHLPGFNK